MMKLIRKASLFFSFFSIIAVLVMLIPVLPAAANNAAIKLSPSSGVSGTTVSVSGTNFDLYTGDNLELYFDSTIVVSAGLSLSDGNLAPITFIVQDGTLPGMHAVSVKTISGAMLAQSQFYVSDTQMVLNRWSSIVGTTIKAVCKGFHAGKEVVLQYYSSSGPQILTSQIADDLGECTLQFNVPASGMGKHNVIATNQYGDSAGATMEVLPSININLPIANIGERVDISGTGFTPNTEVSAVLNDQTIAFSETSDRGSFDALFYVPVMIAGTYTVAIEDSLKNTMWIDFTVDSTLTVSQTEGEVGMKLQVKGTGFQVDGMVKIDFDDREMVTVMASELGDFLVNIDVPVSNAGTHIISATDGFDVKKADFTIESDPPPVPDTYAPKPGDQADSKVALAWGTVYDPSEPVSYTIQIARTKDFQTPIYEHRGLAVSQYTLTDEEQLPPSRIFTYYYWRVRATDSASNVGAWSEPVAFQVQPSNILPNWAKYILMGITALIAIVMIFRIARFAKAAEKAAEKKT
jgi:hypothetical protein